MPNVNFCYLNNNPGNLRPGADVWQGQVGVFQTSVGPFLKFDTMVSGLRAHARTIANYRLLKKIKSLRHFFHTYAPAGDHSNDPERYARFVAEQTGLPIGDPKNDPPGHMFANDPEVDFTDYAVVSKMMPAIYRMESGQDPFEIGGITAEQIDEGCFRAGIVHGAPPPKGYVRDESGNVKREDIKDSGTIKEAKKGMLETVGGAGAGVGAVLVASKGLDWWITAPLVAVVVLGATLAILRYFNIIRFRKADNELGVR